MQPTVFLAVFLLLCVPYTPHAVLLPITGDSTAVWTAIDLLPTDDKMENITLSSAENNATEEELPVENAPAETTTPTVTTTKKEPSGSSTGSSKVSVTTISSTGTAAPSGSETPAATDTSSVPAAADSTVAIVPGTIIITSIPDSAQITINDVRVAATPYNVHGFYPGLYDITLTLPGYAPFTKAIELAPGGTEFITANLVPEAGNLVVISTPENATVSINDTIVGMTPYTSKPLPPGIYSLTVELPGYFPYKEQLGVSPNLSDTLQIPLVVSEKPGLFTSDRFKETQKLRRISFGAATIIGAAAGFILNSMTKDNLKQEQSALTEYREAKLSESDYTTRYNRYHQLTETTNQYALFRSISYGLGIIGATGFSISIVY